VEVAARSLGLTETFRYIPVVTVSGHYEHEIEAKHSIGPAIGVGVPIFDQGQAAVAKGKALLVQSQQKYAALAVEIRSQVRSAHARMTASAARADYYQREVLPLQQQIVAQTQLHYNAMQTGVFQLLQAKQAQIDAGRVYIESLRDYWIAVSELERAVGGRLPALPTTQSIMRASQPTSQPQQTQPPHQHQHN